MIEEIKSEEELKKENELITLNQKIISAESENQNHLRNSDVPLRYGDTRLRLERCVCRQGAHRTQGCGEVYGSHRHVLRAERDLGRTLH